MSNDDAGAGTGDIRRIGIKTTLTCAGSLVEMPVSGGGYRCLVGHAWTALRTLKEKIALARRIGEQSRKLGRDLVAERYAKQEEQALAAADVLHKHLLRGGLRQETGG